MATICRQVLGSQSSYETSGSWTCYSHLSSISCLVQQSVSNIRLCCSNLSPAFDSLMIRSSQAQFWHAGIGSAGDAGKALRGRLRSALSVVCHPLAVISVLQSVVCPLTGVNVLRQIARCRSGEMSCLKMRLANENSQCRFRRQGFGSAGFAGRDSPERFRGQEFLSATPFVYESYAVYTCCCILLSSVSLLGGHNLSSVLAIA